MAKKSKSDEYVVPGTEEEGQEEDVATEEEDEDEDDEDSDSEDEGQDEDDADGDDEDGDEDADEDDEGDKADEAASWLARILDFANNNADHEDANVAAFAAQVASLAEGQGQEEDDHITSDFTCHCGSEHDEEDAE